MFMFHKRTGKYMRPSDKGRGYCCRVCVAKEALRGKCVRKIRSEFVVVQLTKKEVFKEMLGWKKN